MTEKIFFGLNMPFIPRVVMGCVVVKDAGRDTSAADWEEDNVHSVVEGIRDSKGDGLETREGGVIGEELVVCGIWELDMEGVWFKFEA